MKIHLEMVLISLFLNRAPFKILEFILKTFLGLLDETIVGPSIYEIQCFIFYLHQAGYVFLCVCFHLCLFICWFVSWFDSQQDYAKTTEQILTELGGGMGHGPENNPLHFEIDLDHLLRI